MVEYRSNSTFAELAARIAAARRVALVTHERPDGDALGAVLALKRAIDGRGRAAEILLRGPFEPGLMRVVETTAFREVGDDPPGDEFDLIVVVDTGAWTQVEYVAAWLRRHHDRVIGLDHHRQGELIASARIVDPAAASTTVMLLPLLDELGVELTGEIGGIAEALFVGLATDTGWFRFSNADGRAFAVAARLLETGVDKTRLFQLIEEQHRPQRLALAARALASTRLLRDGAVAIMMLGPQDFRDSGGGLQDITNLVNEPMAVGTVRVSILLTELDPGRTKMSFRSKPLLPEERGGPLDELVDVNALARRFGGGGHVHAAGARVDASLVDALAAVIGAVEAGAKTTG